MNAEEQIKYDMMQMIAGVLYTFFIFVCGFLCAAVLPMLLPKAEAKQPKPIEYILPESPSTLVYCSNRYSF
jgi:hypothetical protein